ncbi:type II toxin-antitoxin system death-on-curing family toxin [Ruminococcus sp.]|uniref:type II toxin-antitoxin system death-on-curing family toxin n=1 Tax=Ruminococcus sp. TaxID=41978 RepID=UPI00386DD420
MIKFSKEKVLLLHELIAKETGGDEGVRDFGLLESALESAYQTFDGIELFPSKEEKAAKLGFSLISNHAFVDGNKRIGMYVMLAFLEMNGIYISPSDDDVIKIGMDVASGKANYEDVLDWIKRFESR